MMKLNQWLPVLITGCFFLGTTVEVQASKADPDNAQQVERGKLVYKKFCSLCHGANLEGQPNWRVRDKEGKLPAPPHDSSGHTWHHADELLFGMTKYGLVPPYAPKNYKTDMPGWEGTLSDDDIWAVIAFIKSKWPEELRQVQQETSLRSLK